MVGNICFRHAGWYWYMPVVDASTGRSRILGGSSERLKTPIETRSRASGWRLGGLWQLTTLR
eukprot:7238407-Pyramimonas_sp.AAC.1